MRHTHAMPFGAELLDCGGVRFRLWAPSRAQVSIELIELIELIESSETNGEPAGSTADDGHVAESWPMQRDDAGWHEQIVAHATAGTLYRFRIEDALAVPDPASRFNPFGVHAPSEVIDAKAYEWSTTSWRGRPWHEAVIYQLHLGTFSTEGSFTAAAAKLPELRSLGFTAVQLLPLAAFSGRRGWGYDGVLPFAPFGGYGRPDDLKRFVDVAHGLGLMVLLDAVYNHFGPDGNYLPSYCPEFFNAAHQTPWGDSINFDGTASATVRRFFVDNALYWIEEFRVDGLRLDAVHAIRDDSSRHIVDEIGEALRRTAGHDRHVHLVLENEHNTVAHLLRDERGVPKVATAQWHDDLHHAAHVVATRETHGYYAPYAASPVALLGRALAKGFVYPDRAPGAAPKGRDGNLIERSDRRSASLPSQAFVSFLQNHDHVGNRAFGERLDLIAPPERVDTLLACVLLSPPVPMIFMGEEFAATTPFLYFCDFPGDLGRAVATGRRAAFKDMPGFEGATAPNAIFDPNAVEPFESSRLRWPDREAVAGQRRLALMRHLISLRTERLAPRLVDQRSGGRLEVEGDSFVIEWPLAHDQRWILRVNFGDKTMLPVREADEELVWRLHAEGAGSSPLPPNGIEVAIGRGGLR